MDSLDAVSKLCQEFGIGEDSLELRSVWNEELEWERAWIRSRHKGTRGQYQRAVDNTYSRMQEWLKYGYLVPGVIEDHFLGGVEMSPAGIAKALADWVGTTRRAPIWCSLWWLRRQLMAPELEGRSGGQS